MNLRHIILYILINISHTFTYTNANDRHFRRLSKLFPELQPSSCFSHDTTTGCHAHAVASHNPTQFGNVSLTSGTNKVAWQHLWQTSHGCFGLPFPTRDWDCRISYKHVGGVLYWTVPWRFRLLRCCMPDPKWYGVTASKHTPNMYIQSNEKIHMCALCMYGNRDFLTSKFVNDLICPVHL